VPRVQTGEWPGRCSVEGDPESARVECKLLDLSIFGAGIELPGGPYSDFQDQKVIVEVHAPLGESVSLRLVGEVRNMTPTSEGTRLGIEFVELSETEQEILKVFSIMKAFW